MKKYNLEELCSVITDGTHQTPKYSEDGYIFLSSKDVTARKINWENTKKIPKKLHETLSVRLKPQMNDILLAKNGTTGVAAIVDRDEIFDIYVSLALLRPKEMVYPQYLLYAVNSPQVKRQFDGGLKGIGVPNLHLSVIRKTKIPLPQLGRQQEIVRHLEVVDKLIEIEKEQIAQYDTLIKSRFVEMFGDTVINSLNWEEHRLNEYIEFLTSGSRGWAQYFVDEENELFITIKNVKNNHISLDDIQYINAPDNKEAERTKVKKGDLLVSITADLGRTGVVGEEIADRGAYINQHLSLVRLNQKRINPLYVSYFLEMDGGKRQFESKNQNGVKAGLNLEAIKSLKILVPPLEKQNEYLAFVHQVDKLKVEVQKSLNEMQTLFNCLMQKYFG